VYHWIATILNSHPQFPPLGSPSSRDPMKRSTKFSALLAFACTPCLATVSGGVSDPVGNGLAGVGVSLVLAGSSTTTDANGAWTLGTTGTGKRIATRSSCFWTGTAVELTLAEPSTVSVAAYDLRGALLGRLASVRLEVGSYSLPLKLALSGMVRLRVLVNGKLETMMVNSGGSSVFAAPSQFAARSQGVVDTLRFTWKAKVVAKIPLANPDTSGIQIRLDTARGIQLNASIVYGILTDSRDGQEYFTVTIGSQTWMAQNINFKLSGTDSGRCYVDYPDYCAAFGRLYTWSAVMAGSASSTKIPSGVQGICPSGWHIPSDSEWSILVSTVEANPIVGSGYGGVALKSMQGWSQYYSNGTDVFGFNGLLLASHTVIQLAMSTVHSVVSVMSPITGRHPSTIRRTLGIGTFTMTTPWTIANPTRQAPTR
jgi:uncharacterized protein (TIGR02145 family)